MLKQFRSLQSCLRPPGPAPAHKAARCLSIGRRGNLTPHVHHNHYEVEDTLLTPFTRKWKAPNTAIPKIPNKSASLVEWGYALVRAKYLEYRLHGTSSQPWPVVWTRSMAFIFLPPAGR